MPKRKIIILGAGLAGLSIAYHLQKSGQACQIFEKEPEVGGLCRSQKINGFIFDYSGHLLHFKHRYTFNLIKNLLGNNLLENRRSAWIYSHHRYTAYPFQANLYGLPSTVIKECLLGFIHTFNNGKLKGKENLTFLEWINQTFGKGIAEHFMIPYNIKFWTLPLQKLTCEWLDGFIPVPSLSQILEGTIEKSQKQFGYNAQFWYPKKGGINQLPLALASQIKNLYPNCPIVEIDLAKKEIKMASGNRERFDILISTIPLPEMSYLIRKIPKNIAAAFKNLKWNSIFNLNLGVERKSNNPWHWVYFPEKEFTFFRIGFPHNFSPYVVPANKSSLYIEMSYTKDKRIDKNNIISRIKGDLAKIGILTSGDKIYVQSVNDIKYGYPIYDNNYRRTRERILKYLRQNNILSSGRYGSWRYMSMEDVILDGKNIVKSL